MEKQQIYHTAAHSLLTCTHTDCARRRAARWAHVSWRTFSSAAHTSGTMLNYKCPSRFFWVFFLSQLKQVGIKHVPELIPPWWGCVWARGHTPGLRRCSSHHIASMTHRTGQRDDASPPGAPAKPPPGCPEAHSHSANKPLTSAALVDRWRQTILFMGFMKWCRRFF